MADTKKFSEFTPVTPTSNTNIVGFENGSNVKFPIGDIDLAELGGALDLGTQADGILQIGHGGTNANNRQDAINILTDSGNAPSRNFLTAVNGGAFWGRQETDYRINGTFRNVFGGGVQIIGDVLEFGTAKSSAADHGSVFIPSKNADLVEIAFKWVSGTPMSLVSGQTWGIAVYKLNNLNDDVTQASNWQLDQFTNVQVTPNNNGFPYLRSVENIFFGKDEVYMFVLIETGTPIGSTSAEIDVYLTFITDMSFYQ